MKNNVVKIMTEQHVQLKNDLSLAFSRLKKNGEIDSRFILTQIKKFQNDLTEHLKLENDYFYIELLKKMKKKKMDTEKTANFIIQMKVIEQAINKTLGKYKNQKSITEKKIALRKDLMMIMDQLNFRVELEETGVYMYWEFLV